VAGVFAEAVGQHAAGRTRADDDVIVEVHERGKFVYRTTFVYWNLEKSLCQGTRHP
jgi:hypothetical protein